jgi:WD40 repeat protein
VRVWDLATGGPVGAPFTGHAGGVTAVAVGELDGYPVVVSGSSDRTVRVWDLATGGPVSAPFTGHAGRVNAVAVGEADGRAVMVSGSSDKTMRVWDLAIGTMLGDPLTGHDGGVRSAALVVESDGRPLLASGGEDRTVRIWQPAIEPPTSPTANRPVRNIFISYSHADERYVRELETVLAPLRRDNLISIWEYRRISPGQEWSREIETALGNADIILLLVSPDFLASDYIVNEELPRALERHQSGSATVVPIILRDAVWKASPLGRLQVLPGNGRPVSTWPNRDQAWLDVARGLQRLISSLGSPS